METQTIRINGKFFKVSANTMAEIEILVSTLYGTCMEPYLTELNDLLGKIFFNNPESEAVDGLYNFEYIV